MPASNIIRAPAGERTVLYKINQGSIPFDLDFIIEPVEADATLTGKLEVKASSWIFPNPPKYLPLTSRHLVSRGFFNTFFSVAVIPDVEVLVSRANGKLSGSGPARGKILLIAVITALVIITAALVFLTSTGTP